MIEKIVAARPIFDGKGRRIVGSTDARGAGTEFELEELDPFVLVDDARGIEGPDMPPFGPHPHAGLVAVSYVIEGGPWRSWCNLPGAEHHELGAGDVLITNAGRGAVHDERTVGAGDHSILQIILRMPASHREIEASLSPLSADVLSPSLCRVVGKEHLAPMGIDASVHYCTPSAGQSVTIDLAADHHAGFLYTRAGEVTVGSERVPEDHVAVLSQVGDTLDIEATDRPAEVIVGFGAQLHEPWAKLLGHNGFVVAANEEAAQAKLDAFARDQERFGL